MTRTVATNLTDLHAEPSFLSELLTQVAYGTPLQVLEQVEDWCRVRQTDGYTGWAYAPYLTDEPPPVATHMVCVPVAALFTGERRADTPLSRLVAGTRVRVVEPSAGGSRVELHGGMLPSTACMSTSDLRPLAALPLPAADARQQMIADARRLAGVYYLWGGTTAFGIDCSGLSQLVHRLAGYEIPRDARLQFPAGLPIDPPFAPADLLFFHSEKDATRITHVGLSTGGWRMIHSSRARNGVYEENLDDNPDLKSRFAGARRFT